MLISLDSASWELHQYSRRMCGLEVERRPCNHEVPSSSPGNGSQLWDFSLGEKLTEVRSVRTNKLNILTQPISDSV